MSKDVVRNSKLLKYWASKRIRKAEDVDDFVQDTVSYWLQNKKLNSPFTFLLYSWLRKISGKDGWKLFESERDVETRPLVSDEHLNRYLNSLSVTERASVILHYKWGLSHEEVGFVLGLRKHEVTEVIRKRKK